jgi:hypothetical protein
MNLPSIRGARGIFEFFVPGIFVLLNLGLAAYLFPYTDGMTRNLITAVAFAPALAVIVIFSFGYLVGVVLRLFGADLPDRLSAFWMRKFHPDAHERDGGFKLWAIEPFPFFDWIEQVCRLYLPAKALAFYQKTWGRGKQGEQNEHFFIFIRNLISAVDERAADEIYAVESLSCFLAGMFYALCFAWPCLWIPMITSFLVSAKVEWVLIVLLIVYLLFIIGILAHFRRIRIKEVEMVFAASFRNRALIEEALFQDP